MRFLNEPGILLLLFLLVSQYSKAQGRFVTVGDLTVWTYTAGVGERQPGQPVIVFESGYGTPMEHWERALPGIATLAPIFTYDRPGIGKSPALDYDPTPKNVAENLVAILREATIPPPYVLVGHSLGGVYVRGFANHFPELLRGLIIIDPADFTERLADRPAYYEGLGLSPFQVDSLINSFVQRRAARDEIPESLRREGEVLEDLRRNEFVELNATSLPNIPVHLLVGGRFDMPERFRTDLYDAERLFRNKINLRTARWLEVVQQVDKGVLTYVGNGGHFVHHDQPDILVSSVRNILQNIPN